MTTTMPQPDPSLVEQPRAAAAGAGETLPPTEVEVRARPASGPRRLARADRTPLSEGPALLSSASTMVALVCLWLLAQLLVLGGLSEHREQALLYDTFRGQLAGLTAPIGPTVKPGAPVALLQIPELDLTQVVVEGTSSGDLLAGPGHQRNTPLPGQAGISFVLGRATTYGGPFRHLGDLRPGDQFSVVMAQGTVKYSVLDVRRAGDPQPQPLVAGAGRLTLVSSEGTGHLAALRPGSAIYVDADTVKPFQPPAGRAVTVPADEMVLAGDPGVLPLLTLYLALLVGLTIAIVAARQRWSAVLVWTVAGPVAIALAWATTDAGVQLLPNVL